MRALLRSPVAQFLAVGLLTLAAIVIGTGVLSGRAASEEALAEAQATTQVLGRSVAQPAIPRGLITGDAGAIDKLDRTVLERLMVGDVFRVKIWAADGTILYSDETRLIGMRFHLDDDELEILRDGGSDAGLSDLSEPENQFEKPGWDLVEVYTQIWSPEGQPLLFEAYYAAADIEARRSEVFQPFMRITVGGLLVLLGVATPMLWVLTRRLTRAAAERERLLLTAVEASDAERRRIARDLHDGVVQDLAGTAFAVSALSREEPSAERRASLERAATSLRDGLRSLRSLLVEIHPPNLRASGLESALDDLVAPVAGSGTRVSVAVADVEGLPDTTVALVWRVAQEAVRNASRHASADSLDVIVTRTANLVTLEVRDDGIGFRPESQEKPGSFGLRGLESLVADLGGQLEVRSLPGHGTTVRLEVRVS
ncbi:ATP-binding region, ATPase domain protein [metagenome]|uniref:histidine kinase n=1 Tax=metagenome TaxID=256318 RepID=A0A2P2CDA3_9ZZZZ